MTGVKEDLAREVAAVLFWQKPSLAAWGALRLLFWSCCPSWVAVYQAGVPGCVHPPDFVQLYSLLLYPQKQLQGNSHKEVFQIMSNLWLRQPPSNQKKKKMRKLEDLRSLFLPLVGFRLHGKNLTGQGSFARWVCPLSPFLKGTEVRISMFVTYIFRSN